MWSSTRRSDSSRVSQPRYWLINVYTYKVQPINSHYINAIHTYLNTYMYLYNHTSRVTQAMHMEQRFQQICLIKNAVVLHESWLQFIFLSSHVLPRKNSWQYFGICIFESKLFYKFKKAKEATQNTRVYITISYLLVMLLTLASDLVIFLYREDRRPLRTRRVVIPCNMRSGWTRSPHSAERYLPVINILL